MDAFFDIELNAVFADIFSMDTATFKHFKYEIALGAAVPMPKPAIDFFPHCQYSVQQFLFTLCKENIGALGKKDGKWAFGEKFEPKVQVTKRHDIVQILDFAEQLKIIEPEQGSGAESGASGSFIPYKLSEAYWDKFDKFTS